MEQKSKSLRLDDSKMEQILRVWKSKSLNSKSIQNYTIPFKNDVLSEPKIIKINESIFCLYLNSLLMIFKLKPPEQKQANQYSFQPFTIHFKQNIKFVAGHFSENIFVGFENQLHVLKSVYIERQNQNGKMRRIFQKVETIEVKHIPKIKGVTFIRQLNNQIQEQILVIVTSQKIIKYSLNNKDRHQQLKIIFSQKQSQYTKIFKQINTINILSQDNIYLYLFAVMEGTSTKLQQNDKGGQKQRKCQFLYLIKFNLDIQNVDTIQPTTFVIDHVFQIGIFTKSKIFQCGPSAFLISLYEQIIVIKYHFQNFVVWDNISLASSKSIEKKGQLILADKIVMVYTQNNQIFAHNIFFSYNQSKLKYPRIDNFKGNDNDQQILYDAIVLEYEQGSFMKVLFYFKQSEVCTPGHKFMVHKEDKVNVEPKELTLAIRCIQQNDPLIKLAQLFKNKKTPQQISQFVQRFNIDELNKSKCQWSVSEKNEKDIENLLLQIKSNEYIQNQLTQILKSNPHDLRFLSKIQKKQIQRYKKMLATKILKNDQDKDIDKIQQIVKKTGSFFTKGQVEGIKQIIKWVLESIMFQKKLAYSKNFLEFMEYEFIDIGKLKAASLKEEIKLLSCKGYQKRLQYFLNSFKYMILANFQNIFQFLIEDKTVPEIEKFFKENFPFILPKFKQPSLIFQKKNQFNNQRYIRQRRASFAPQNISQELVKKQQNKQQDECQLWKDHFSKQAQRRKIQTKQSFRKQINDQIQSAFNSFYINQSQKKNNNTVLKQCLKKEDAQAQFKKIFEQFTKQTWFLQNKSKLHSIIQCSIEELKQKMDYLNRIGVFHLLIKFFYKKIAEKKYRQQDVDSALENFRKAKLIPESFQQNILIRRQVYYRISQNKKLNISLPLLQQFLVYEETKYFHYLFSNYRGFLLKEIKGVYEKVAEGFFKQKFQLYLDSQNIDLPAVIDFLDQFEGNSDDDIRMDVFTCIKKLLKVSDKENAASFVNKLMQKQILKNQGRGNSGIDSLIDQAKITFGFYFYDFFKKFAINETYRQLIEETLESNYDNCKTIKNILQKYTKSGCLSHEDQQSDIIQVIRFEQKFGLEQFQIAIKEQPLDFFGILLYLLDTLRFQIKPETIFDKFIELLLQCKNYEDIVYFIDQFRVGIGGQAQQQSQNENFYEQQQQFKLKNNQLLRQFYQVDGVNVKDRLISNILIYNRKLLMDLSRIHQKLFSMTSTYKINQIQPTLIVVSHSFEKVLDALQLENQEIKREKEFLDMLKNIKQIEPLLVTFVLKMRFQNFNGDYLEQNSVLLNQLSSFMFMIKLFQALPSQKFSQLNDKQIKYQFLVLDSKQIHGQLMSSRQYSSDNQRNQIQGEELKDVTGTMLQQLYLMECIYEHFRSASKYNSSNQNKQEQKVSLTRFLMELAMRLIKEKKFFYAKQVTLRIINKQYYFRDVFYQFVASVKQMNGKPNEMEFRKFINQFIQATHQTQLTNIFNTFINQNKIRSFDGQPAYTKVITNQKQSFNFHSKKSPLMSKQSKRNRKGKSPEPSSKQKSLALIEKVISQKFGSIHEQYEESVVFTKIIFQQLLKYNRADEAYYFLVRNQLLSVSEALQQKFYNNEDNESYALISIYLKCLKKFLCEQFYPSFDFYRIKHETLINQFERRDIIKDINIAISRLKQMILQLTLNIGKEQNSQRASQFLMREVTKKLIPDRENQQNNQNQQKRKEQQEKKDSRLEKMKNNLKEMQDHLTQLSNIYKKYMNLISENPVIKLNDQQIRKAKQKFQNISRQITPGQINIMSHLVDKNNLNTHNQQIGFSVRQLQQKKLPTHQDQLEVQKAKIKQQPKIKQLQREINLQIKETKLLSQKYQKQPQEKSKQVVSKNIKAFNQLKEKQKSDLQSVKQSYKSKTAERVNNFLEQLKLRKSKINEKSQAKSKFSGVSLMSSEHGQQMKINLNQAHLFGDLISPPDLQNNRRFPSSSLTGEVSGDNNSQMKTSRKYQVKLLDVDGNTKNIYMPVTINKEEKDINSRVLSINSKQASHFDQRDKSRNNYLRQQFGSNQKINIQIGKSQIKTQSTFEELIKLFSQKQPQCSKYIQKLQIVKNNLQVGLQLTKNIYSTINSFDVFIKYIGFLLEHYPKYKEVIEEKAYKIGQQAMGIENKINLKELFPIEIFINTANVSLKQYYKTAYEMMRPNLMKILAKPQTNVHGIAILYRFGFGSQNFYYYRVYEDYISVLLKNYNQNSYDQKKLFLLGQKLRTLYSNINTENRQSKFELLIRQVSNQSKRRTLCKQILKILERRGEMLTGEKQTDLKDVLLRLS